MKTAVTEQETDRRSAERYTIEQEIRWRLRGRRTREAPATGRTVNISSAGVLFKSGSDLPYGKLVEIAIRWPAPMGGAGDLQLVASGRLVRSADGLAAIQFQRREFQSRSSQL